MEEVIQSPDGALSACGPIAAPSLYILIVEDQSAMGDAMEDTLWHALAERFPDARISRTTSRKDAERIIAMEFPPDATILDLTLDDSGWEETLACVPSFDLRTAVVIVTGHNKERIEEMLINSEVEILEKRPGFMDRLIHFIARAIARGTRRRASARFTRMTELLKEIEGPTPNASP